MNVVKMHKATTRKELMPKAERHAFVQPTAELQERAYKQFRKSLELQTKHAGYIRRQKALRGTRAAKGPSKAPPRKKSTQDLVLLNSSSKAARSPRSVCASAPMHREGRRDGGTKDCATAADRSCEDART